MIACVIVLAVTPAGIAMPVEAAAAAFGRVIRYAMEKAVKRRRFSPAKRRVEHSEDM